MMRAFRGRDAGAQRWTNRKCPAMTYVIALPCVDLLDKTCIDECPVDCIYEGDRMLYIHPDECVDCGACEPVCPVQAISFEADVPPQWRASTRSTSSSSRTSAQPAARPGPAGSAGTTRSSPPCRPSDSTPGRPGEGKARQA